MERAVQSMEYIGEPISKQEMDTIVRRVDYMGRMENMVYNDTVPIHPLSGIRSRSNLGELDMRGAAGYGRGGVGGVVIWIVGVIGWNICV